MSIRPAIDPDLLAREQAMIDLLARAHHARDAVRAVREHAVLDPDTVSLLLAIAADPLPTGTVFSPGVVRACRVVTNIDIVMTALADPTGPYWPTLTPAQRSTIVLHCCATA